MDFHFPQQLFPSFYSCGPPDVAMERCVGSWGSYDRVRAQSSSGPPPSFTFRSRSQVRGETWHHTEPVSVPLLHPKHPLFWPSTPPNPLNFTEHMQNFYMDHCQDNFGCMSTILGKHFDFTGRQKKGRRKDLIKMCVVKTHLDLLNYKLCRQAYPSGPLDAYSALLSDVVHAIPPQLLGSLLYEELVEQRERMLFSEGVTGGALAYVPLSENGSSSQHGYLIYPGNQGLDCLNFHKVELQHSSENSPCVDASSTNPFRFQLRGPIRQISAVSLFNSCCVGVRSDHLCGVWRSSEGNKPRLLQVVNTREVATCISVSPHVLGEVLVASESGAAHLWTVGRGMQTVREEDSNLYFNANSPWRWCEFSAHPRVVLYADRTGVELTDMRVNPVTSHTLFRIGNTAECRSGERLILSRYLGDAHSFHHLITTQCSAYIVDERFPGVPMLKWDHIMQSPPLFCHAIPGGASAVGGAGTTKVLLGSHSAQEMTLLQYSGGRAEACFSQGAPQALLRPKDSLEQLPVQIPHRLDIITSRLSSPAAGLTCIHKRGGRGAIGEECVYVFQLTEAGDVFYQILEREQPDASQPLPAETQLLPQREAKRRPQPAHDRTTKQLQKSPPLLVSDASSDKDVIGPTQGPTEQRCVAETPEKVQQPLNEDSDSSEEERGENLKQPQVVVNDTPELDHEGGLDAGVGDGEFGEENDDESKEAGGGSSRLLRAETSVAPVKLSSSALHMWKHWLQKVTQKTCEKKRRPYCPQHFTVKAESLLHLCEGGATDSTEEERVGSLRRSLRVCMSKRSLVLHSALANPLQPPQLVPLHGVDTALWSDELSRRLTASWQGQEAWQAWWEERLGMNTKKKEQALRRKRRREKEARRGQRLELCSSFTSSLSYQSELDDFSEAGGWSSATSQPACSDTESLGGSLHEKRPRAETSSSVRTEPCVATTTAPPQRVEEKRGEQQLPSSTPSLSVPETLEPPPTGANPRRNKRAADHYLSSLFASQDEPSQHAGYFLDEGGSDPPAVPVATSSQLHSPQSASQRSIRVDLSQDTSVCSHRSLGRRASQPKKKSRMGF